jgi:hypothetical protein
MRSMLLLVPACGFIAMQLAGAAEPSGQAVANPYAAGLVGERYAATAPAAATSRTLPSDPLRALGAACRVASRAEAYAATPRPSATPSSIARYDGAVVQTAWVSDGSPRSEKLAVPKPTPPALLPHTNAAPVPNPQGMNPLRGVEPTALQHAGGTGPRDASNPLR